MVSSPTRTSVAVNPTGALNAASIFQGVLTTTGLPPTISLGYLAQEQRFDSKLENSIFVDQNFLAADLKITLSGIKVHYDAGYGGGITIVKDYVHRIRPRRGSRAIDL